MLLLALPVLLAMTGLVVDGAHAFGEKRRVQNAADAAALAAAQNLIGSLSSACPAGPPPINNVKKAAECYSEINGGPSSLHQCSDRDANGFPIVGAPNDTNCYTTPWKGNASLVEVKLTRSIDEFFLDVIGLGGLLDKVSGRAVAGVTPLVSQAITSTTTIPGTTDPGTTSTTPGGTSTNVQTITTGGTAGVGFFKSTACPAITYQGSGQGQIGALVTNGGFSSGGTSNKFIEYLALGKRDTAGCFDNSAPASIGSPGCTVRTCAVGPFAPLEWPLAPPPYPDRPACLLLYSRSDITFRMRANNVVTLTTAAPHHLLVGDTVKVAVQNGFDGTVVVTAVGSPTTFSYANTGANSPQTADTGTATAGSDTISTGWETTHPPGIYCAFGAVSGNQATTITLSATLTTGAGYTFFAPNISVSGGSYKCYQLCNPTPSGTYPTLFYASGNISFQGNAPTIVGFIFAPFGEISFTGGGVNGGDGFMEAQTFKVAGNFATYTGRGPLIGGTVTTTTSTTTNPDTVTTIFGTTVAGTYTVTTTPGATTGSTDPALDE